MAAVCHIFEPSSNSLKWPTRKLSQRSGKSGGPGLMFGGSTQARCRPNLRTDRRPGSFKDGLDVDSRGFQLAPNRFGGTRGIECVFL